jgi:2-keto-4-pentenoate hydratase/2-oxohepta-3-ene-1,7-dioic acid hydratase in catechol pathway
MRIANIAGRLALVRDGAAFDVNLVSRGQFPADPQAIYDLWEEFRAWAGDLSDDEAVPLDPAALRAPAPRPRQVFGIGLNYRAHAAESKFDIPEYPPTFTKFPSCIAGPYDDIRLPSDFVDWEVEVAVIIGVRAQNVAASDAWRHVAGITVGQDLSERRVQMRPPVPQFSLGKSYPGFGPLGPVLVTPDEFENPDDLELGCLVNGEQVQHGRTSDLIFPVPELVEYLSSIVSLLPGDVIFSGTPAGVGIGFTPARYLTPGDEVVSFVTGVGTMRSVCVPAPAHSQPLAAAVAGPAD